MPEVIVAGYLALASANVALALSQCVPTIWGRFIRWWYLRRSAIKQISIQTAPRVFMALTKFLHAHSHHLQHQSIITSSTENETIVYNVPMPGTDVCIETSYGWFYLSSYTTDGYNIAGYELSCPVASKTVIDTFMLRTLEELKPVVKNLDTFLQPEASDETVPLVQPSS